MIPRLIGLNNEVSCCARARAKADSETLKLSLLSDVPHYSHYSCPAVASAEMRGSDGISRARIAQSAGGESGHAYMRSAVDDSSRLTKREDRQPGITVTLRS